MNRIGEKIKEIGVIEGKKEEREKRGENFMKKVKNGRKRDKRKMIRIGNKKKISVIEGRKEDREKKKEERNE